MTAIVVSSIIFSLALGLIFSEKVNRTIVALGGAVLMVASGMILGFYTEEEAMAVIDFNTLFLLLGMMILVGILEPTGFFQYLAVVVGKLSRGKPARLLILLGTVTTLISMFLDNVTTVVLIAPVTILICEILGMEATPFLIALALLSNTGGVGTLVGDPPNILIGSAAGLTFNDFLIHSLPIVLVVWGAALWLLLRMFKKDFEHVELCDPEVLDQLNPREALKDAKTAKRALVVVVLAVVAFLLEERMHMNPSFVALSASALGLAWVRPDVRKTLNKVEWDILIFFAALFVMVGGLEAAGVLDVLANLIARASGLPTVVMGVILLWSVALLSAVVDNIPITIAIIPVIQQLAASGLNVAPFWWALALGAGFGGNGTIIGSTANVVVTSLSERTRNPITPALWSKRGLPVMLLACGVATVMYVFVFFVFGF